MDSFEMPASAFLISALRLVRVNPLTLDPGALVLLGARQMKGREIVQFPCYLEYKRGGEMGWTRVNIENNFEDPK